MASGDIDRRPNMSSDDGCIADREDMSQHISVRALRTTESQRGMLFTLDWTYPRRALVKRLALIAITISCIYNFTEGHAAEARNQCSGVLRQDREGVYVGGERGKKEGICVISKEDVAKVLAGCRVGQNCLVRGAVDDCNDSSECVVIFDVFSASRE
jgi:hypothetical protein